MFGRSCRRGVLGGLLGLGIGFSTATAGTIPILSDLLFESNNITGANVILVNIYADPVWKAPTIGGNWISYAQTGYGGVIAPDTTLTGNTITGPPTAVFTETFTIPVGQISIASSSVSFWADDTAAIYLDSNPIPLIGLAPVARDTWCLAAAISCQPIRGASVDLSGLGAGTHTLTIQAYQIFDNTFGVLYEGNVITADLPEPGTFTLLPFGATILALLRRRSRA